MIKTTPKTIPKPALNESPARRPARTAAAKSPSIADEIDALSDPSFMNSLARGLSVIRAFSDQRRSLTIAQISHKTGIPRASVRRCLHTLKQLGYADAEGNYFFLQPKVLTLGYSYLSSTPLAVLAQPALNDLSRQLHESCSLAVLDGDEILYVARSATARIMSVALNTGSRLPAYCTSLGRVMLASQSAEAISAYLDKNELKAFTQHTIVSRTRLQTLLQEVAEQGYAIVEEELEVGLRSIAVPLRGASGRVVAALNVGAQAGRVSSQHMKEHFLPSLLRTAQEMSVLLP